MTSLPVLMAHPTDPATSSAIADNNGGIRAPFFYTQIGRGDQLTKWHKTPCETHQDLPY